MITNGLNSLKFETEWNFVNKRPNKGAIKIISKGRLDVVITFWKNKHTIKRVLVMQLFLFKY